MNSAYVQARDGNLYVGPSRVTLDSIILLWRGGQTPEEIQQDFPSVPLAIIYGAIAYYLEHPQDMDQYLRDTEDLWRTRRAAAEQERPEFYARMRQRLAAARPRPVEDTQSVRGVAASGDPAPQAPRPSHR